MLTLAILVHFQVLLQSKSLHPSIHTFCLILNKKSFDLLWPSDGRLSPCFPPSACWDRKHTDLRSTKWMKNASFCVHMSSAHLQGWSSQRQKYSSLTLSLYRAVSCPYKESELSKERQWKSKGSWYTDRTLHWLLLHGVNTNNNPYIPVNKLNTANKP